MLTVLLSSCGKSTKHRVSVAQDWKYIFDDNEDFKNADYDDTMW